MSKRHAAAIGGVAFAVLGVALAGLVAIEEFPRGLVAFGATFLGGCAIWFGMLRTGAARLAGVAAGLLGFSLAVALLRHGGLLEELLAAAAFGISSICVKITYGAGERLPAVAPPDRPVLFYNPKSGGGKAIQFGLADEARRRGIEPIELGPADDLETLARDAVQRGADALAMAGGDGSQAIIAAVASEHDMPYACIPAGTRNHFALDLGVDRNDVVGALDALVDGGERVVDLAEVNGRVFVNNVSLGVYAEAVQRQEYRGAKLRTILSTMPEALGPESGEIDLRWTGPGGHEHQSGAAILVSNNRYRLGHAVGSGTRPRIDDGLLGVTVVGAPTGRGQSRRLPQRPWREWTAPSFVVDSNRPIAAGIDGEAARLDPPLTFRIRPGVLRVRIANSHPGASPSAMLPETLPDLTRSILRIAIGKQPLQKEN